MSRPKPRHRHCWLDWTGYCLECGASRYQARIRLASAADLDAALEALSGVPSPEIRELMASFWVYYRCGMVGCRIVEPHEHGGGPPAREMTPDELANR